MRRILIIALSFLGSALILWLVLRGVPLANIWTEMQKANPMWLLASFICITLGLVTRAIRWRGLLHFKIRSQDSLHLTNITFMLNQLPLRLGEVARAGLAPRYQVPFFTAATSILVERLLDTLFIVIMVSLALTQVPNAAPEVANGAALFGVLGVLGFAILVFFATRHALAHQFLAFFMRLLPFLKRLPLERLLDQVLDGLEPLTHWRGFAHSIGWTLIAWTFSYGSLITLLYSMNIQDAPYLLLTMLAVGLTAIGIAIPISVMSLGPFQAVMLVVAHELFGVDEATAITLGFLFNGVAVGGYLIWGAWSMFTLGVSFSDLLQTKNASEVTPSNRSA